MVLSASTDSFSNNLITATELNTQPGKVLDQAYEHPVTITRNEQAFALLRREEMAKLVESDKNSKTVIEVLNIAYRLLKGEKISFEDSFGWLSAFDSEELGQLIEEIFEAFRSGVDADNWEELQAIIHEWHESAIAINNSDLSQAFNDECDEVPLTRPNSESVVS